MSAADGDGDGSAGVALPPRARHGAVKPDRLPGYCCAAGQLRAADANSTGESASSVGAQTLQANQLPPSIVGQQSLNGKRWPGQHARTACQRLQCNLQDKVVLVGGAYADARRALQPGAPPLEWPAGWRALETCTVSEVCIPRMGTFAGSRAFAQHSRWGAAVVVPPGALWISAPCQMCALSTYQYQSITTIVSAKLKAGRRRWSGPPAWRLKPAPCWRCDRHDNQTCSSHQSQDTRGLI